MIKSKLIRNVIISIPLLATNCLGVSQHPTYIVKDIQNKTNNIVSDIESRSIKFLKDTKKRKKKYEKKLKEEQELLEKEKREQEQLEKERQEQQRQKELEQENYNEIKVEVSFYCPCSYCCDSETHIMANGEQVYEGAIAAPEELPFGTQLEFDGSIWTVCDRGGYIQSYIDEYGDIVYRLDVFLPNHEECLKRGRYITTAKIIN